MTPKCSPAPSPPPRELLMPLAPASVEPANGRLPLRGRGACPTIEGEVRLPRTNPSGMLVMKYRFRRLKDWTDAEIERAIKVLTYYFEQIGSFRRVNDAMVRILIGHFREGVLDKHIRWAINAKVTSKTWVATPVSFFGSEQFEKWLLISPEYKNEVATTARADARRKSADPAEQLRRKQRDEQSRRAGDADAAVHQAQAKTRRDWEARVRRFKELDSAARDALITRAREQLAPQFRCEGILPTSIGGELRILQAARALVVLEEPAS